MDPPQVIGEKPKASGREQNTMERGAAAEEQEWGRPGPGKISGASVDSAASDVTIWETIHYDATPFSARHHDKDTTEPISFYLSSLEELLSWKPTNQDAFNIAVMPLAKRLPPLESKRPRTLVCHDLMGGYLQDRFIQGSDTQDSYIFYHWQYIDIFVYFSHHMFTLPPVCWTNAAHKHGVSVLGTFITEWEAGARVCESFLAGEESSFRAVADQMVRVAQFYRFDGWLINIENLLSVVAAKNTPHFLRYLTEQMHQHVPGGLVIWYDSVIENGELKWQNELNEKNRVFFDSCDGIFTNYNWTEQHAEQMSSQAVERRADVYIGVDVFARGKVVGGYFDTNKSLQLIRRYGFSAALFAPGWVYECLDKNDFLQNQNKFWSLLEEYLPIHSISTLPFITSFCIGCGKQRFFYGKEEDVESWSNLSAQEMQPLFVNRAPDSGTEGEETGGWVKTQICPKDAWLGGSSLLVEGMIPIDATDVTVRLFSLQVPSPPKLLLSMVYKLDGNPNVNIALELTTQDTPTCQIGNISVQGTTTHHLKSGPDPQSEPSEPGPGPQLQHHPVPGSHAILARLLGGCGQQSDSGWKQYCYELELQGCLLQDLFIKVSRLPSSVQPENFSFRLGEIKVLDACSLSAPLQRVHSLSARHFLWRRGSYDPGCQNSQLYLSVTLQWSYPMERARQFRIYCQGVMCHRAATPSHTEQPHLIGLAYANIYRVVDLAVPSACTGQRGHLEFSVQPVTKEGFTTDRSDWGKLVLEYADQTHTQV
ncbi:cytosolic endo-beta-N-acetylglucosaminidase isoform X2 [Rhinatrema bivittatum]|uniref:cytosolic endo-beta-N-acetylglucosaminidase isoform X2 n=1 Tax=Rhinatrema bivittatum TaxID=194408 RepID=UPI001129818B|nr:cytosolic endo-beta-N-acetylglucosaminidase isoform X2 [Rhinatrema bivittatum]